MKEKNLIASSDKKFLFDVNIFEDDSVVVKAADVDPPPIFSLDELENAKKLAFEKGHQVAMRETRESHEEHVAGLIAKITSDMQTLFASEQMRETIYEQESIRLASALLKKLFPAFEQRYGLEELKYIVSSALEKTRGKAEIVIEAHPANVDGLESYANEIKARELPDLKFRIISNEGFALDACKITWSDGGMVRNSEALADEIAGIMEETLAAKARSSHSNDSGD